MRLFLYYTTKILAYLGGSQFNREIFIKKILLRLKTRINITLRFFFRLLNLNTLLIKLGQRFYSYTKSFLTKLDRRLDDISQQGKSPQLLCRSLIITSYMQRSRHFSCAFMFYKKSRYHIFV